jgi:hypothetical protein
MPGNAARRKRRPWRTAMPRFFRRHQPGIMPKPLDRPAEMMGTDTGPRSRPGMAPVPGRRQDGPPPQLTTNDHRAFRINAMDLKHRLGDVETDSRYRLHAGSSETWALNNTQILGTRVLVESRPQHQKRTNAVAFWSTDWPGELAVWLPGSSPLMSPLDGWHIPGGACDLQHIKDTRAAHRGAHDRAIADSGRSRG